ncbi:MAG: transporter substrate-binding domain-containing protein [Selenomonadaceae bacterium]|nr:transporter substrate-binding domain-containing protein [Selenomonadaceae bacterium]
MKLKKIQSMKDDGTLDKLIKEYVTGTDNLEPKVVEIAKIDGADTIKIGVTGDLPPLDLVLADGKPAGFNTAILAEISKRINKNLELVQIESGARAAALSSKQIDVIFWATIPTGDALKCFSATIDKPDNVELSSPYFQDDVVHIVLKK